MYVFVSTFVLVAHGNVIPSNDEVSIYEIKPEVIAGYAVVVGQEANDVGADCVFSDEASRVFVAEEEPRVGSLQEPQGCYVEELADERFPASETADNIPIASRAASVCMYQGMPSAQLQIWHLFKNTCWCSY